MFKNASSFEGVPNYTLPFNTTVGLIANDVTDVTSMFEGASKFNGYINEWDLSTVTSTSRMFCGATSFVGTYIGSISFYDNDTKKVMIEDMSFMFKDAYSFNPTETKLGDWFPKDENLKFINSIDMSHMFQNTFSFKNNSLSLGFSSILDWDISKVSNMSHMFDGAISLQFDSSWDFSKVNDMTLMFANIPASVPAPATYTGFAEPSIKLVKTNIKDINTLSNINKDEIDIILNILKAAVSISTPPTNFSEDAHTTISKPTFNINKFTNDIGKIDSAVNFL
jgi:hypothetical protein